MLKTGSALAALLLTGGLLAACDQAPEQSSESGGSQPAADCTDPPIASPVLDNFSTSVRSYARAGGNLDQYDCAGNSLVFLATGPRGGPSVLRALVESGADPNAPGGDGTPPLVNAAAHCNTDSVRILLEAGVDPGVAGPDGRTAAEAACTAVEGDSAEILALLEDPPAAGE